MHVRFLLFAVQGVLLVLLIMGCGERSSEEKTYSSLPLLIAKKDTLVLETSSKSYGPELLRYYGDQGSLEYLVNYSFNGMEPVNRLEFYDIHKEELAFTVPLEEVTNAKIHDYYIKNLDSILVFASLPPRFLVMDTAGNVSGTPWKGRTDSSNRLIAGPGSRMGFDNGVIQVKEWSEPSNDSMGKFEAVFHQKGIFTGIELRSENKVDVIYKAGQYPELYRNCPDPRSLVRSKYAQGICIGDQVVMNFPYSPDLFIYSKNGDFLERKRIMHKDIKIQAMRELIKNGGTSDEILESAVSNGSFQEFIKGYRDKWLYRRAFGKGKTFVFILDHALQVRGLKELSRKKTRRFGDFIPANNGFFYSVKNKEENGFKFIEYEVLAKRSSR